MVQGTTGQMWLSWAQGVLRGEACQSCVRLRDSPAAAVHMEAEGGGEGREPQEGVWLMSARLGGNVCARRRRGGRRAARRVEAARAGSGARRRRKPARQAEEAPSNIFRLVTAVCHTESWTWGGGLFSAYVIQALKRRSRSSGVYLETAQGAASSGSPL